MERLIVEIEIASSFEEIMKMKKSKFEKIVTEKLKAEAFNYLKNKVKSKGPKINYWERLEMQNYLKPNYVLTFQEQVKIFSFRSEMNEISLNYQEHKANKTCICKIDSNNQHLYECIFWNNGVELKF